MKKLVLLLCLAVLAVNAFAQSVKEYKWGVDAFYDNNTETMRDSEDKPITGLIRGYYESGKILAEWFCKNGKQEGLNKGYYESGKISWESLYNDGKLEGIEKSYYENGKVEREVPYKNDKREGLERWYYESGKIMSELSYNDGKLVGVARWYSESGKIEQETLYKNGRVGFVKFYFQNGAVAELQYENDIVVSGVCVGASGKRTPLTNPEIAYWNNGENINCE
jgi:antitoxin component YwqK of YwqJK toxin-antitoxin module